MENDNLREASEQALGSLKALGAEYGYAATLLADALNGTPQNPPPETLLGGFQQRVSDACEVLFWGDPTDVSERLARFFEESNETCQALGMTREEAHQLVDYTYGRPIGDPAKEVGSVMVTLAAVCVYADLDVMGSAEADLEKLQRSETIERIRAKRATRHGRGPLPGLDPVPAPSRPVEIPGELELYEGKLMKVVDARRTGWWRFHEGYDRNGYCDNPGRGY